ncbi:hypothetical protein [Achromobacter sp. DH1f]|uniref:hypothetical protein n=1 Tax=Achromobacter sp. DH1f TaxID=1397275 RepID=UPI0004A7ED5B|nr:hypothetical protein [Achromobacter sp. DH1f]
MIKSLRFAALALVVAVASGCAHKIGVSPDLAKLTPAADTRIDAKVAYYISEADLNKEVTTPGGGGDKVSYKPYKDIETAFYKMLTNVFKDVTKLKTPQPTANDSVDYVLIPVVTTESSSSSLFTWPPTKFKTELSTTVNDAANQKVTTITTVGDGEAEFSEFKRDFGLAGRRSTQSVLQKTQEALLGAPEFASRR